MCVASRCEAAGGGGGVRQGSGLRQPRDRAGGLGFSWRPRDKDYREIFGGGGYPRKALLGSGERKEREPVKDYLDRYCCVQLGTLGGQVFMYQLPICHGLRLLLGASAP